jgi:UDP-2,4-diacetamido-2,4,6-trideoxy-beta-L-altropyranose hydrolase
MRRPFLDKAQQKRENKDKLESVVVCFGGADKLNLTEKVCRELKELSFTGTITAIIGGAYQYKGSLDKLGNQITIKEELSAIEMAEEFWTNELAVVPCSSVLFEALACQVPVITGAYVDNQKEIERYFRDYLINIRFVEEKIKLKNIRIRNNSFYNLIENVKSNLKKVFEYTGER